MTETEEQQATLADAATAVRDVLQESVDELDLVRKALANAHDPAGVTDGREPGDQRCRRAREDARHLAARLETAAASLRAATYSTRTEEER